MAKNLLEMYFESEIEEYNKNYKGKCFRINTTKYNTVYHLGEIDRDDYVNIKWDEGFTNVYTIGQVIDSLASGEWYFYDLILERKEKLKKILSNVKEM